MKRDVAAMAAALLLTCLTGLPLQADDTAIYFSGDAGNAPDSNVMLLLDNSGSMKELDGGTVSRIDRMKTAMLELIGSATENTRIGIGTFNGARAGGAIHYPVRSVTQDLCPGATCDEVRSVTPVRAPDDDATELLSGDQAGKVTLDAPRLDFGDVTPDGSVRNLVALRFDGVAVPRGAVITSARLNFDRRLTPEAEQDEAEEARLTSDEAVFTISAEATGNSAPFSDTNLDLSGRFRTSVSAEWKPKDWGKYPYHHRDAEFASVVQSVTDRVDWCGGRAMTFFIEGSGARMSSSRDAEQYDVPTLHIAYDPSTLAAQDTCLQSTSVVQAHLSSDDARQATTSKSVRIDEHALTLGADSLLGFRFEGLEIPVGAVVTEATLRLQASAAGSGGALNARITGIAADSAVPFSATSDNLGSRARTVQTVDWPGVPDVGVDEGLRSPDISTIVQALLDRPDRTPDGAIGLLLEPGVNSSGERELHAADGGASAAARLDISWSAGGENARLPVLVTARDALRQEVLALRRLENTPLIDTYLEGALYMTGGAVKHGALRNPGPSQALFRVSHPDSYTGGTVVRASGCTDADPHDKACASETIESTPQAPVYDTPMDGACQANQIVLLSDGRPNDNSSVGAIKELTGVSACSTAFQEPEWCARELAGWLHETDHSTLPGMQNVTTHTVGFNFSGDVLRDIAVRGGGGFHEAGSASELNRAMQTIFDTVAANEGSVATPALATDSANRLNHRGEVYYNLFEPSLSPRWRGNLKRYSIGADDEGKPVILDADALPAINTQTGRFLPSARSHWSTVSDGADVAAGGAANRLDTPIKRYTWHTIEASTERGASFERVPIGDTNKVSLGMLGLPDETTPAEHAALLNWAAGLDANDEDDDGNRGESRRSFGDPLHSTPVTLDYAAEGKSDAVTPVAFFGTNEGFLHAIDTSDGSERSAIMPPSLLPNLNALKQNAVGGVRPYGLDGAATAWLATDLDKDGVVDTGDKAILVIGMRRGGRDYYAFDVTDPALPKPLWRIEGGAGDFSELGLSFSRPVLTRMNVGGKATSVLVFGGGYDAANDERSQRAQDAMGRAVYIVDALTGAELATFDASELSSVRNSMPAEPTVLDIDLDGLADRIYIGDTGARLFRIDIDNRSTASGISLTGGLFADLGDETKAGNRKFFHPIDVAFVGEGVDNFLALSVGSGWRANPNDTTVQERFYSLRDANVFQTGTRATDTAIFKNYDESELQDVSRREPGSADTITAGWRMDLDRAGEKVLSRPITISNRVLFTSYLPQVTTDACVAKVGSGSVYAVNVLNGDPVAPLSADGSGDGSDELDVADRRRNLVTSGIPSSPAVIFSEQAGPVVLVGAEAPLPEVGIGELTTRTWWAER